MSCCLTPECMKDGCLWAIETCLRCGATRDAPDIGKGETLQIELNVWMEFIDEKTRLCGLCANKGYITRRDRSAAGCETFIENRYCICPNGRAWKKATGMPWEVQ